MNTEQRNLLRSLIEPLIKNTNDNLVINATVGCKANNSFRYQGLSVTALCDIYPGNKVWVFRDTKSGTYYGVREEFNPVLNERTFTRKYIAPDIKRYGGISFDYMFAVAKNGEWQIWLSRNQGTPKQIGTIPFMPPYAVYASTGITPITVEFNKDSFYADFSATFPPPIVSLAGVSIVVATPFTQPEGGFPVVRAIASPSIPVSADLFVNYEMTFSMVDPGATPETNPVLWVAGRLSSYNSNLYGVGFSGTGTETEVGELRFTKRKLSTLPEYDHLGLVAPMISYSGQKAFGVGGETITASVQVKFNSMPVFGALSSSRTKVYPWVTTPISSFYAETTYAPESNPIQVPDPILPSAINEGPIPRYPQNWRDAIAVHTIEETPETSFTKSQLINPLLNFDSKGAYEVQVLTGGNWKEDLKVEGKTITINKKLYKTVEDPDPVVVINDRVDKSVKLKIPRINPEDYGVEPEKIEILGIAAYSI